MKKFPLLLPALFFLATALHAQRDETLFGKTGLKLTGAWGGTVLGFVGSGDETAFISGGFGGLEFNKSLLLGFGGASSSESTTYNGQKRNFDLSYGGFMVGFVPRSFKVVHPKIGFLMGSGDLKSEDEPDDKIFVVQPSLGVEINVFQWFRFGLEGGYRFVSDTSLPKPNDGELSSFLGELSLRFGWSWGKPE
ncbi:MAG: hypothetical protein HY842_06710 [Bacteroidetes bacterium]|nr:hypothetical protein [Bacteroidota bacterium]